MARGSLGGTVAIVPVGDIAGAHAADLVRRLAAEGASVVLVADADALERSGRLAAEVEGSGAGRPSVFAVDSADPGDLDALVEFVAELFGGTKPDG